MAGKGWSERGYMYNHTSRPDIKYTIRNSNYVKALFDGLSLNYVCCHSGTDLHYSV